MNLFISLIICYSSSYLNFNPVRVHSKKTFYYFCESQSKSKKSITQKQNVLYTDVQTIFCEEEMIPQKTKEWANYVGTNCKNENGCSSDLNYYQTKDEARNGYFKMLKNFSDSVKYIASKADFR